jgi:hypothetical protein
MYSSRDSPSFLLLLTLTPAVDLVREKVFSSTEKTRGELVQGCNYTSCHGDMDD